MTNKSQTISYNLDVICEGLKGISECGPVQVELNKGGLKYLEDVFDFMPLDFIGYLVTEGVVSRSLSDQIHALYSDIDRSTNDLSDSDVDYLLLSNDKQVENWRSTALEILNKIKPQNV